MTSEGFRSRFLVGVLLLFAGLVAAAWLLVRGQYGYLLLPAPLIAYQLYALLRFQQHTHRELGRFVEAVHYRDFSRHFDERGAPADLQPLRRGFNEINATFKVISKEKETQYHYLQQILELVDTGILSYELKSGEVVWMNEPLKRMLQVPYLKQLSTLAKRDLSLYDDIDTLMPGEQRVTTIRLEKSTTRVLLSATAFHTGDRRYKLIAFQNVNEALDETESKAWQKLLGVLTHELMNSVAPISSLADTLKTRLQLPGEGLLEDLELGIDTIRRRSEGLLKFAETYRSLSRITRLQLQQLYVRELFANLHLLIQPTLEQKGIELEILLKEPQLSLEADPSLLEQVLINLIINAIEAVRDRPDPRIVLSADLALRKKLVLKVADNGQGMTPEVLDKIFVPFFSTKKNGSGIGLSLCKQILMLHRAGIQVQSVPGQGTAFLLEFEPSDARVVPEGENLSPSLNNRP